MSSNLQSQQSEAACCVAKINECTLKIEEYINNTNAKISGEYKMAEGYSFDFESLLEKEVQSAFSHFKEELQYRDQIVDQLNII